MMDFELPHVTNATMQKISALGVTCKENYNIALVFNKYMKLHMFECFSKTPLQYCVFHGKTLTRLERQIYNGRRQFVTTKVLETPSRGVLVVVKHLKLLGDVRPMRRTGSP